MPLTEEEKRRLAQINIELGSGLSEDEEVRLQEVEETLRIPRKQSTGGFTEISGIGRKFIPDVKKRVPTEFIPTPRGVRAQKFEERTVEGPEISLERKRTFLPDQPEGFRPGVEALEEFGREKAKSAVSGLDFLLSLGGIPGIGEQILSQAEETRGGGQQLFEDILFGAPLDIALTGGAGAVGKAGIRAGARGALKAGVSKGAVRRGLKQTTTFPTARKAGRAIARTPAFQAVKKRLGEPVFEFGQPVDTGDFRSPLLSSGVPSQESIASTLPPSGTGTKVSPRLTSTLEPEGALKSIEYTPPSQLTKRAEFAGFDVDPLPIYRNYNSAEALSKANKAPFEQQMRTATGLEPEVRIKSKKSFEGKTKRYKILGKDPAEIADVLAGRSVVNIEDIPRVRDSILKNFDVVDVSDSFAKPTDFGYHGINFQIKTPNGQIVEYQLHTPESLAAGVRQHKIYQKWRDLDLDKLTSKQEAELAADKVLSNKIWDDAQAGKFFTESEDLITKEIRREARVKLGMEVDDPAALIAQETKFQRAKAAVERAETGTGEIPEKIAGRKTTAKFSEKEKSQRIVTELGKEFQGEIDDAARNTVKVTQTQRLSQNLDVDELTARELGSAYSAEELTALNNAWNGQVKQFQELAARGASAAEQRAALLSALELQETAIRAGSESGRALRILQEKAVGQTIAERNFAKLVKKFGGKDGFTKEMQERMAHPGFLDDPQLVGQFIRNYTKANFGEKFHEYWINGILSGIPTHVVNNTSNTLFWAMRPTLERPLAAAFDVVASGGGLIRPRQRFFGESFAEMIGLTSSLKMSPRALWEAARRNATLGVIPRPIKTLADPALARPGKAGRGAFQEAARAFETEVPSFGLTKFEGEVGEFGKAAIKGKLGRLVRFPGRALVAADEFFKNINLVTDLHAKAYRQAAKEAAAGKIKRRMIPKRMADIVAEPPAEMIGTAKAEAIYRTFQTELGKFGKRVQKLRDPEDGVGQFLQYIIPFVRTPVNIAKTALQFNPLNWLRIAAKQTGAKRFGGRLAAGELQDEMAKATAGSMLAGGVYLMALEGNVTGSTPRNAKERSVFFESGKQAHSFRLGNTWIPYGRFEPVGMSMGLAADFMQNRKSFNPTDVSIALGQSMAQNITSKTYLKGLSKLFEAMSDPERGQEHLLEGFARSILPNIAIRTSKGIDPTLRDPKGSLEAVQATGSGLFKAAAGGLEAVPTPGFAKGVQGRMIQQLREFSEIVGPVHTMWGEPVRFDEGAIGPDGTITGPLFRSVNPFRVTLEEGDPVTEEVNRLAKIDTAAIPPSAKQTIQRFEREKGERLPREVIDTFSTGRGREYKARALKRMGRADWARKTDEQKIRALRRQYGIATDRWRRFLTKGKLPR